MAEKIKQIAMRLKTLREISGETVEKAAKAMGISKAEYVKFESGKHDISASFLYEVAAHYNVELTALLTGSEPHAHNYSLVRKGCGPKVDRSREYKYRDLAYNFAHKKMEVFEVEVDSKTGEKPTHFNSHPGQEYNYCLEGTLMVVVDKNEVILKPGDSIYFDSGIKHAMAAMNKKPARFLAVIS
jgi:transcriptional regulator with XRE-family HTH domain